jgi:hypothetical protein
VGIITLTKPDPINSQAPPEKAGAPEITPAMVQAGVDEYLAHCPDSGVGDELDRSMVTEIYRKMLDAGSDRPAS